MKCVCSDYLLGMVSLMVCVCVTRIEDESLEKVWKVQKVAKNTRQGEARADPDVHLREWVQKILLPPSLLTLGMG